MFRIKSSLSEKAINRHDVLPHLHAVFRRSEKKTPAVGRRKTGVILAWSRAGEERKGYKRVDFTIAPFSRQLQTRYGAVQVVEISAKGALASVIANSKHQGGGSKQRLRPATTCLNWIPHAIFPSNWIDNGGPFRDARRGTTIGI